MNRKTFAAAVAATFIGASAQAATVLESVTQTMTQDGEELVFDFTGLPTPALSSVFVTIGSSGNMGDADSGFDLRNTAPRVAEFFQVSFDGVLQPGNWSCTSVTDAAANGTTSISTSGNWMAATGSNEFCFFSLILEIDGPTFNSFAQDGALSVAVDFADSVNGTSGDNANDAKHLTASLSYEIAPVPLPASGLLLLAAIGGGLALRRRKGA
jgi:hypothetical protein